MFELLESKFMTFPLKEVPQPIKTDMLRGEICFMEGIRPQKTTIFAERFVNKHLMSK